MLLKLEKTARAKTSDERFKTARGMKLFKQPSIIKNTTYF